MDDLTAQTSSRPRSHAAPGSRKTGRLVFAIIGLIVASLVVLSFGAANSVLLLGVDANYSRKGQPVMANTRTDTIILAYIQPWKRRVDMLSVPRDTKVAIPGYGMQKINAAHVYGGPQLAREMVREVTGIMPKHYLRINFNGFKEIVDALGGVEIEVEKALHYDDNAANLHIHLQPGVQRLNGTEAMGYVRFRHDALGDLGRIPRQQKFLRALVKQVLRPASLVKLPKVISIIKQNTDTDLSTFELVSLAVWGTIIGPNNVYSWTMPGTTDGAGNVVVSPREMAKLRAQITGNGQPAKEDVKIVVLNGCGIPGIAGKTAAMLKSNGYREVTAADADRKDYPQTVVYYKDNSLKNHAKAIAKMLRGSVKTAEQPSAPSDITIILGLDQP